MSGVAKAVGKVFKKVTKVVSKVLPIAVAVGAVYFTAGAALGLPGTAGGWGAAVSSLTDKLGATGILGKVLTGAATQAGYGAVLGSGLSLITGGDPMKGLQQGALFGGVSGGAMGGLGFETDPLKGIGTGNASGVGTPNVPGQVDTMPSQAATNIGPIQTQPLAPAGLDEAAIQSGANEGLWAAPGISAPAASVAPAVAATPATSAGSGLMPWLEKNQTLAGYTVAGLGSGLMNMGRAGDATQAGELALQREREQRAAIAANYGSGNVRGFTMASRPKNTVAPATRFDPVSYSGSYQYDPQSGRIVFVPQA